MALAKCPRCKFKLLDNPKKCPVCGNRLGPAGGNKVGMGKDRIRRHTTTGLKPARR